MKFLEGASGTVVLLSIWALSAIALLPFAMGFPSIVGSPGQGMDISVVLLILPLVVGAIAAAIGGRMKALRRRDLLKNAALAAGISFAASLLLKLDVRFPLIEIPTPHLLVRRLGVDGESAYDADVFEIYCEIWLVVAFLFAIAKRSLGARLT